MSRSTALLTASLVTLVVSAGLAMSAGAQITAGQRDDFQNGTTQNWRVGILGAPNPVPPVNVPTGGPAGADDRYLKLTSIGGNGAGSKLTVINLGGQWAGNYLAAGITGISFNAINLGATNLFLRILLEDPLLGPPVNVAASATAQPLAVGSGWTPMFFPLFGPNGLTALSGNLNTLLTGVTAIRIFNSPTLSDTGPAIVAQLGVDNVTAVATPEPRSMVLVGTGVLLLILRRARHRGARVRAQG